MRSFHYGGLFLNIRHTSQVVKELGENDVHFLSEQKDTGLLVTYQDPANGVPKMPTASSAQVRKNIPKSTRMTAIL